MKTRLYPVEQGLDVAIIQDKSGFASLEEEWTGLYERCPTATPFQSWAWLYSWWEHYGKGYELRLITVRDDEGLLVGLAPLMQDRRWGFGRLSFVGTGITDYLDILASEGWEERVSGAVVEALGRLDDWRVADMQELRPGALTWSLFRIWEGMRTSSWQSSCPGMEVEAWDELLASRSRNHRSTLRRSLRRAEKDGVYSRLASMADAEEAVGRWIVLHREAWGGKNIAPEHLDQRFKAHMRTAVREMIARDIGGISEFWRDGEVVASQLLLFGKDFVGQYLFGATQQTLQRYQVNSLYIKDAVTIAHDRRSLYLDMLRGEESYKLRWKAVLVPNHRLILGRDLLYCFLYAGYQNIRTGVERYVYSKDAPRWVRKATAARLAVRRRILPRNVERRPG